MSKYNKKGYTTVKARDPETGRTWNAPVPSKGSLANINKHKLQKANRARLAAVRVQKRQIKDLKKLVPLDQRAKVNWGSLAAEAAS